MEGYYVWGIDGQSVQRGVGIPTIRVDDNYTDRASNMQGRLMHDTKPNESCCWATVRSLSGVFNPLIVALPYLIRTRKYTLSTYDGSIVMK